MQRVSACTMTKSHGSHGKCAGINFPTDYDGQPANDSERAAEAASDAATRRTLADFTLNRLADDTVSAGSWPSLETERSNADRPLWDIAREIRSDWASPYFGAVPYIDALACLSRLSDRYGAVDGEELVQYFLSNAKTWRGETARRIKAELRDMLKAAGAR